MEGYFFKSRKRFGLKKSEYDLGMPIFQTVSHLDRHFLLALGTLNVDQYENLYDYHKKYYLENIPKASEKLYFEKIYELVHLDLKKELQKDSVKMSPKEKNKSEKVIKNNEEFLKMMKPQDKWGVTTSEKATINNITIYSRQEEEIKLLKEKLTRQEKEIKLLKEKLNKITAEYENLNKTYSEVVVSPKKKIDIKKGDFGTLISLISALKEVKEPELFKDTSKSQESFFKTNPNTTWVKLVANNFSEAGEEIKTSRIENYISRERPLPEKSHQCRIVISDKKVV